MTIIQRPERGRSEPLDLLRTMPEEQFTLQTNRLIELTVYGRLPGPARRRGSSRDRRHDAGATPHVRGHLRNLRGLPPADPARPAPCHATGPTLHPLRPQPAASVFVA